MEKYLKRISAFVITLSIVLTTILLPNASTDVEVKVQSTPKIDVMLTSKDNDLDLSNFEGDVLKALKEKGIDTSDINFTTVERNFIDTNTSDAAKIFNSWKQFPFNTSSSWYYDSNLKAIRNNTNPAYETGFMDTNSVVKDVTLYSTIYGPQPAQPLGYIFRVHQQANDANRYNMYMLWVSQNTNTGKRIIGVFKIEGLIFDYNIWKNYAYQGSYTAMALAQWNNGSTPYWGWIPDGSNWYNFGGYPYTTPATIGTTATNIKDSKLKTTTLGWVDVGSTPTTFDLKLEVKGEQINVIYNNNNVLSVKDSSYKEGYYGFFQTSHVDPRFYGISVETTKSKTFEQVLREPTWREDAKHVIVNVDNNIDDTLTSSSTIGEILSRTLADDIHFIQWGTDTNKSTTTNFIKQNDSKGLFTYNNNYNKAIEDTVNYIESLIEKQETEEQHITIGQEINLSVTPENFKTDAISDEYPNGRWKINHEYKYFTNNLGQSTEAGFYSPNLNCTFDKPGKYEITFDDEVVKTIYVHRKPVADFEINIDNLAIELKSLSYDLDSSENNGIANEKWYYKEVSESTWTEGKLTKLDKTKIYMIKLEVTDEQGITNYTTKYVGTGNPVSKFTFTNDIVCKYNKLEINNSSYDPIGYDISTQTWELKKDGKLVGTYSEPILDFNTSNLGPGNYSYTLTITNSVNTKSESYTKSFTIVDDVAKPEIAVDTDINNAWLPEKEVDVEISDNESNVSKWRYEFVTSPTPTSINDDWSNWETEKTEMTINSGALSGRYYLHIQAYDEANNLTERTIGPFNLDNTNPVINGVDVEKQGFRDNKVTIHAFDEHSGIVGYALTKYEPTTFDMRSRTFAAVETPEFQESNEFKVDSDGLYTAWAIDALGNIETSVCEVTNSNQTDKTTTVYAEIGSEFKVTIPKKIVLDGATKSGTYTVTVEGDIAGLEIVNVTPDSAVTLSSKDKADVIGTITQDKLNWTYSEIYTDSKILANGSISASGITAGAWNGTFNFAIKLENNGKYTNSEWSVEYQDVTFDMEELDNSKNENIE